MVVPVDGFQPGSIYLDSYMLHVFIVPQPPTKSPEPPWWVQNEAQHQQFWGLIFKVLALSFFSIYPHLVEPLNWSIGHNMFGNRINADSPLSNVRTPFRHTILNYIPPQGRLPGTKSYLTSAALLHVMDHQYIFQPVTHTRTYWECVGWVGTNLLPLSDMFWAPNQHKTTENWNQLIIETMINRVGPSCIGILFLNYPGLNLKFSSCRFTVCL